MPKTFIVKKETRLASTPKKHRKNFQSWKTKSERFWNEEDSQFLKANYKSLSAKELSAKLGRSVSSIRSRAHAEGLTNRKDSNSVAEIAKEIVSSSTENRTNWSRKEVALLRKEFKELGVAEMSKKLGRSAGSISGKAHALGLTKKRGSKKSSKKGYRSWTENELSYIKDNFEKKTASAIAKRLRRTVASVYSKAKTLKLTKQVEAEVIAKETIQPVKKSISGWIIGSLIVSNIVTASVLAYLLLI